MLYHLLVPLADQSSFFNLFQYISFRAAWAMVTALAISYALYPWFIERMKRMKMEQIIRAEGPQSHVENKVGTPTMGGIPIIIGITLSTLLWARLDQPVVWMSLIIFLGYGGLGFYDDYQKVMKKSSDGLAGRWKLVGQTSIAGVVLGIGWSTGAIEPDLVLPFFKNATIHLDEVIPGAPWLGVLYVVFGMFVLTAFSNAVNLTDGLDGLAIGPVMTSAGTMAILAYIAGRTDFSAYLSLPYVAGAGELTVFSITLVGAGLGFLWYNAYPAQIFMGDVGSLALGGALGILSVLTKHEFLLALIGGIFVLETLSVIIQVFWYKRTGNRVFKMAPIHHHYEKVGWSEPKIIVRFWIISILLALVALMTLKIR
ncbi:MAG: phospho-N-acetylmuramoyl-pentapeptide-transferase [Myxococcota bacterium]|nr:phospho-N-acetylmuramoyl-pentapeptide-transferase [Myxococcota bacterium]